MAQPVTAVWPHGDHRPVPGGVVGLTAAMLRGFVVGAWVRAIHHRRNP